MQCIVKEQARMTWPESPPDYQAIGSKLGIPGLINRKGTVNADLEAVNNIRSALFSWLRLPGNSRWLLVFDNADDLETLDIQEYLPKHGGGAILITSRRPHFSEIAKQFHLEGLDSESAVKLLLSLARLQHAPKDIQGEALKLVKRLGLMPLAISHAGHYIHETKIPLEDYSKSYEKAFMTVQSRKPKVGWNVRDDTAATTWDISFSRIEKQNTEAAYLLVTCSYLNPEEISENLWEDKEFDNTEIKERVLLLASYSLVKIIRYGVFSVHPVVHSWARERLQRSEQFQTIKRVIMILGKASQRVNVSRESNEWKATEERGVASHLNYLHQYLKPNFSEFPQREKEGSKIVPLLASMINIALVFNNQGNYDEVMQWYERALTGREKALGKDHPLTLSTVNDIAGVFDNQGNYDEARQWCERALAGREKALGKDHPSTLDTVHNIAKVFCSQGNYDEAMQWYERALAGSEKALGKNHPSTLSTVSNIATVFWRQGNYDEAIQWYERALTGREKVLRKDHPSTLDTAHNIATVFSNQGNYDEVMQWYERALTGREKALGKDHPLTLSTVNNIAGVFDNQGNYDEAMQWYERALAGREKALGKDHPSTLDTVNNIAGVFSNQGNYDEAMQYNQGNYDEAMQWYERALASHEKALRKDHPSTLTIVHNIAVVFRNQGNYDEAMQWYERALAGSEKTLGKDHPSTLSTVNSIAGVFDNQENYDEAMQRYRRALASREKALGKDHPLTLDTVHNIAGVFENQGNYDEAMQWYKRALAGCEKALGKDHPSTLSTINSITRVFKSQMPKSTSS
ncbi:uncharacterized protein DFL_004387 [Arthrobotrys flagrans]|uniref:Uncharacterized protein n=1 Tax=Arthrobotrys flagrans TaxID=97331 RepID=A0A437A4Q9_ARTFL|nr:hypothetical protein DFL_004387 [Arthrobotrys flagrans]